jgi:hypothetical protein
MENEKNIKMVQWWASQEIEDLKQSEDLQTLEKIAHYASQLQAPTIAQAALDAFKVRNHSKTKQSKNFKLQSIL